jgi:hypothetical protein
MEGIGTESLTGAYCEFGGHPSSFGVINQLFIIVYGEYC